MSTSTAIGIAAAVFASVGILTFCTIKFVLWGIEQTDDYEDWNNHV